MDFVEIAIEYERVFDEKPPILTTLSTDNELYLKMLKDAIDKNEPLTRDDLGKVFMTDEDAFY